jgi:hypothetical protein
LVVLEEAKYVFSAQPTNCLVSAVPEALAVVCNYAMISLGQIFRLAESPLTWLVVFAAVVFCTQIGSLSQEVIDWDESTLILMASNILDGNLPYIERFDNKPPLMFFMLAGVMGLFGESLLAVRLFGDVCIIASSVAAFAIARWKVDTASAGLGVLLSIFMSALNFGQHTSTELPATAMLMAALWLIVAKRGQFWTAALAGLLISLATLTRTNLAVVAVAFGLYFVWASAFDAKCARWSWLAYALAGLAPPVLLSLLYASANALDILKLAAVDVPLAYARDQMGAYEALQANAWNWVRYTKAVPCAVFTAFAVLGVVAAMFGFNGSDARLRGLDQEDALVLLMFGAILLSVLISGAAYPHYWLQFIPLGGVFCSRCFASIRPRRVLFGVSCALVMISFLSALNVNGISTIKIFTEPGFLEKAYEVRAAANRIDAARRPGDTVWAMEIHLVLWHLHVPPISRLITHPSNATRAPIVETLAKSGYIDKEELRWIIFSAPALLSWPLTGSPTTCRSTCQDFKKR